MLSGTEHYPFSLVPRSYANNALEPYIDEKTMDIHYNGHHATYVKNLNDALKSQAEWQKYSCKQLLIYKDRLPEAIRTVVYNNAGGHENHTFFWNCLTPNKTKPSNKLLEQIKSSFGSFEAFKDQFNEAAKKVFGSGWAWLCLNPKKNTLIIVSTKNQDSPITDGLIPLLGLDVWEHAYYLTYQNKRASYIDAFWSVINWPFVEENYRNAII